MVVAFPRILLRIAQISPKRYMNLKTVKVPIPDQNPDANSLF